MKTTMKKKTKKTVVKKVVIAPARPVCWCHDCEPVQGFDSFEALDLHTQSAHPKTREQQEQIDRQDEVDFADSALDENGETADFADHANYDFSKDDVVVETDGTEAIVHVEKTEDVVAGDKAPTSLADMFDRFQKKLYLIDVSGSMNEGMNPEDEVGQYNWTPEILSKFREYIKNKVEAEATFGATHDPLLDVEDVIEEVVDMDDEHLKKFVIDQNLIYASGITPPHNYGSAQTESKIQAVRGAMESFVEQRFQKFPEAHVGVFTFDTHSHVQCYPGSTKEEVMMAIRALSSSHGGTQITQAVERALSEFKRRPSRVTCHHIILVTDGQDVSAGNVKNLLAQMKEMNVVFDFIFVRGQHDRYFASEGFKAIVEILKSVCKETGGEYNEVSKSSDFKKKFLEVSSRLALPPARG